MCTTCGCSHTHENESHEHHHHHHHHETTVSTSARERVPQGEHEGHEPQGWAHDGDLSRARIVQIEQDILSKNASFANRNRRILRDKKCLCLNLVSSPGSGKTTLLVKTIEALRGRLPVAVVEGDQQTSRDADRIRATGAPAVQVNTGKGCHLDAHMVEHAMEDVGVPAQGVLFVENVGNLVCPADFDLGEEAKVVILSVTEGEDKPIKYPNIFANATLMILSKTDLLPHVSFNVEECLSLARRVNPGIEILKVSSTTGEGMEEWIRWIQNRQKALASAAS